MSLFKSIRPRPAAGRQRQISWKKIVQKVQDDPQVKKVQHLHASARGYESWPYAYAYMISMCTAFANIVADDLFKKTRDLDITVEAATCALVAVSSDAPFRHLGAELARAFLATKPLPCTGEKQMPYPAFVLNLPKGLLLDDTGSSVNIIIVLSYTFWEHKCNEKRIKVFDDREHMSAGGLQVAGLSDDGTQLLKTVNWNEAHIENYDADDIDCPDSDPLLVSEAIHRMMRIVLNSMAAMTWKKDLLEVEYVTAGAGFSSRKHPVSQRPIYWIGRNYIRKQRATTHTHSTGVIKSPHWRSGHWHTIKHGQGRLKSKVLWFEPIYVNAATQP